MAERRKQLRPRVRTDLTVTPQRYGGRAFVVVKDPILLRYYRFPEREHFLMRLMDGRRTLPEVQHEFERHFPPDRLKLEHLEAFARRLVTLGLAANESPHADLQVLDRRRRDRRAAWWNTVTNVLSIRVPLFDPDRLLDRLLPWLGFLFRPWFAVASGALMLAALMIVTTHFDAFRARLPAYQEFFNFQTMAYLWLALGMVKVVHEFGHGLSCKAYGGEVHEMGVLFLCLSPCLYCNVSDAWTLPGKWRRILVHAAGIYVELMVAALATLVWWNSGSWPFLNHLSLAVMVICSVSTVLFNANPLLRLDGYYALAAWLEVPNLTERADRLLRNQVLATCLGVRVPTETGRRMGFLGYAIISWVYRWVVTFSILWFLYEFLAPYKLGAVAGLLAALALGLMIGRPLVRLGRAVARQGRIPDMQPLRVTMTAVGIAGLVLFGCLVPLPVSRVRQQALVQLPPDAFAGVYLSSPAVLERLCVRDGERVEAGDVLAEFRSLELENRREEARSQLDVRVMLEKVLRDQAATADPVERARIEARRATVIGERALFAHQADVFGRMIDRLRLRAPRAGVIMGLPRVDQVGRLWEDGATTPFCTVGDPQRLSALVPVATADYRLLREDLARGLEPAVAVHVPGGDGAVARGRLADLPESEARTVPAQLAHPAGGPLAVTATSAGDGYRPQAQHYLVAVHVLDDGRLLRPGSLVPVKIECRPRSCAWWLWRTLASTFDLGLI